MLLTFIFQGLRGFCNSVNQLIASRLIEFYSTEYVTASVIAKEVFASQMESLITQFISTMTNDFLLSFAVIRVTTQANSLLSSQLTNYFILQRAYHSLMSFGYLTYSCTCASPAKCSNWCGIVDLPTSTIFFRIPGIKSGCYIIEALLQSDLRCFYDQTCLAQLVFYIYPSTPLNLTTLDQSLLNRSFVNSTIENLVDQLMVENWTPSLTFESYYSECMPTKCAYTVETKNTIIYIATVVIGLIDGLTTALKLILPRLVNFIAFCVRKWRARRHRIMPVVEQ